jgi:protein-S-isoprenylcysteine O-methyltransferase Ste14
MPLDENEREVIMSEPRQKNGEHPFGDTGQLILLVLFLVVWVIDSFLLKWSNFPAAWAPLLPRLVLAGVTLVTAVMLVRAGHSVIGHGEGRKGLMTTGAFGRVRHPLYLGSMLFYLGLVFATFSVASLVVFALIVVFYDYIAAYEERLLEERFGEEYKRYKERSGRWLPGVG